VFAHRSARPWCAYKRAQHALAPLDRQPAQVLTFGIRRRR
jgi:hypothetical protein